MGWWFRDAYRSSAFPAKMRPADCRFACAMPSEPARVGGLARHVQQADCQSAAG
jgi:hypothetical protein